MRRALSAALVVRDFAATGYGPIGSGCVGGGGSGSVPGKLGSGGPGSIGPDGGVSGPAGGVNGGFCGGGSMLIF